MPKTRDKILQAAIEEIAEEGWGGARTRSIAERAGVNGALVHYHFASMEDLLVEAVATAFARTVGAAEPAIQDPDPAAGLEGMADVVAGIDPDQPEWLVLMEAMLHTRRVPRLADLTVGLIESYREAMRLRLDDAVAAGTLPATTDTTGLSLALMALVDGLGLYAYANPDFDVRRAGHAVAGLLRGAP